MSRLSFALLVSSSITFLLGGFADSNAASTNDPRDHKGRAFRDADVKGAYAFSFDGVVIAAGPVAATGVVIADGNGNITSAVRTLNFNGAVVRQTFTCTYSVNPNGTGSAECPVDDPLEGAPAVETFDFVLEDNARAFRLLGTTAGFTVLGSGAKQ